MNMQSEKKVRLMPFLLASQSDFSHDVGSVVACRVPVVAGGVIGKTRGGGRACILLHWSRRATTIVIARRDQCSILLARV